jgi:hypothetical protein
VLQVDVVGAALTGGPRADRVVMWRLRDHLETAVLAAGGEPQPYTHLPESMRGPADAWFGIDSSLAD